MVSTTKMSRSELTIALREWSTIPVASYDLFACDIFPDSFVRSFNHEEMTPRAPPPDYLLGITKLVNDVRERKRATLVRMFQTTSNKLRIAKAAGNFKETDYLKRRLTVIENDIRRISPPADK